MLGSTDDQGVGVGVFDGFVWVGLGLGSGLEDGDD